MITKSLQLGFAPDDDCKSMLLNLAQSAKSKIRIADYSFNMSELVDILIEKHKSGLDVSLILDKSQSAGRTENTQIVRLKEAGVPYIVGTSDKHRIMHLKVIIVDDIYLGSGSYNFTEVAGLESNNFQIVEDSDIVGKYISDWQATHDWIVKNEPQN